MGTPPWWEVEDAAGGEVFLSPGSRRWDPPELPPEARSGREAISLAIAVSLTVAAVGLALVAWAAWPRRTGAAEAK
jgi:hypothetical protein